MSYFITIDNFRTWLNRAQRALVSKNKVRKDLWTDFCDIILFEDPEEHNTITISQSNYTSISTFLQTEGRSDTLKDDSILNWITTLHELRKILNEEIRYTATTRLSTPIPPESPEEKKYNASTVATQTNSQITTQSVLTSSSSDPLTTTTRVQTHPLS